MFDLTILIQYGYELTIGGRDAWRPEVETTGR